MKTSIRFLPALILASALPLHAQVTPISKSETPGPTVLILTEPATKDLTPEVAVNQAACWPLKCGSIVSASIADAAAAIAATKPDAVVTLHVSREEESAAVVSAVGPDAKTLADTFNHLTEDSEPGSEPIAVGIANQSPAAKSIDVVMTQKKKGGSVPSGRVRVFRQAIYEMLKAENMTDADPWLLIPPKKAGEINVALYAGTGSGTTPGTNAYPNAFKLDPTVHYTYIGSTELRRPKMLDQFDVIVFCGGSGSSQGKSIGKEGVAVVQNFVKNGGGYVSSCAGSYLASTTYDWSLGIVDSKVVDREHWARGSGDVDCELTPAGKEIFGEKNGTFPIHYANGPLMGPAKAPDHSPFTVLCYFRGDMHKGVPGGVMPGTPAIIAGQYGKGRVICFSPHPEYTAGLEIFIPDALHWVLRKPAKLIAPTTQAN